MRRIARAAAAIAAASALLLAAAQVPAMARSGDDIAAVRAATVQFKSVAAAEDAGYTRLVDAAGIACIDNPAGGMGIHYVNIRLVLDPSFNPTTPEVLVYEPDNHGNLNLVAVEYVAFEADWVGESPPVLFGEHFHRMAGAGESEPQNRYGLPAFYELHLWLWKHNPSGMFQDWNPKVSC